MAQARGGWFEGGFPGVIPKQPLDVRVWDKVPDRVSDGRHAIEILSGAAVFDATLEARGAMDKIPMTAAGYAVIETELKHRQQVERPRIIQQITDARTHGDLSENAEYHAAKESQSLNEGAIAELEDKLARAEVIDVSKLSGDTIKFGATVTLVDEDTDEKKVWQIVGEPEADAKKGKISITSPLARALIGKAKGASVEVVTPGGAKAYEIKKVEWR
jgi:transcription elongation factor GreA